MTPPTPAEMDAYKALTERLGRLADFVGRFAPAYGECSGSGSGFERGELVDADTPAEVKAARGLAVLAAFEAIKAIARKS